jgi:transcriptional regulator with XRE-family HTH domain
MTNSGIIMPSKRCSTPEYAREYRRFQRHLDYYLRESLSLDESNPNTGYSESQIIEMLFQKTGFRVKPETFSKELKKLAENYGETPIGPIELFYKINQGFFERHPPKTPRRYAKNPLVGINEDSLLKELAYLTKARKGEGLTPQEPKLSKTCGNEPCNFTEEDFVLKELGYKLRKVREEKRLSLQDASESAEISTAWLSRLEAGKSRPSAIMLAKIARIYDLSIDHLLEEVKGNKERFVETLGKLSDEQRRFLDIEGLEPERLNYKSLLEIAENGISGEFEPMKLSFRSRQLFLYIVKRNVEKVKQLVS